jgi:hypothetical protein
MLLLSVGALEGERSARGQRVIVGRRTIEVARVKITEAGQQTRVAPSKPAVPITAAGRFSPRVLGALLFGPKTHCGAM